LHTDLCALVREDVEGETCLLLARGLHWKVERHLPHSGFLGKVNVKKRWKYIKYYYQELKSLNKENTL
jgi:hypothetical protein